MVSFKQSARSNSSRSPDSTGVLDSNSRKSSRDRRRRSALLALMSRHARTVVSEAALRCSSVKPNVACAEFLASLHRLFTTLRIASLFMSVLQSNLSITLNVTRRADGEIIHKAPHRIGFLHGGPGDGDVAGNFWRLPGQLGGCLHHAPRLHPPPHLLCSP